ncbi:hypothetical protein [Paenibacillus guangzhouensis]|nr:hypothetical protein [Paenibacillus guangzhouensis]
MSDQMEELKKRYQAIPVPESLKKVVQGAIEQSKGMKRPGLKS